MYRLTDRDGDSLRFNDEEEWPSFSAAKVDVEAAFLEGTCTGEYLPWQFINSEDKVIHTITEIKFIFFTDEDK